MKHESQTHTVSRREALVQGLAGVLGIAAVAGVTTELKPAPSGEDAAFVPDNDYPFFGYKPETPA